MEVLKANKSSIIAICLSGLVIFLAFFIKPHHIIPQLNIQIPSFEVPQFPQVHERKKFAEINFRSPFPTVQTEVKKTILTDEPTPPKITMAYRGRNAYIIVGDEIRKEGESYGEFLIEAIREDKVLLKTKRGGKRIWVNLEQ